MRARTFKVAPAGGIAAVALTTGGVAMPDGMSLVEAAEDQLC